MNIIRLSTAGSVDDGKSTFIGRLLFDTESLPKDKIAHIEAVSKKRGLKETDLSLITDGLTAEREQGITIDVAHIYFATQKRKYIIADSPGHVEYTRNMITGASNAQVFMILIDARNGIVEQTKRHLFVAALMEIKEIMFVINKMDLVDHSQEVYESILEELKPLREKFNLQDRNCTFFPISAKYGDHVVKRSDKMTWYQGPTVIDYLESIDDTIQQNLPFRFNVQYVIRPHSDEFHDFRGYAGKVVSGKVELGETITVAGSGQQSKIKSIHRYKDALLSAEEGDSVVIELENDIDVSRGDLLQANDQPLVGTKSIQSRMCWLNTQPLNVSQKYILRQGSFSTQVKVNAVEAQLDFDSLEFTPSSNPLHVNGIGQVSLKTAAPVLLDDFSKNPRNGAFILIDPISNATVAVGFKN
jgi:sulfate adenylyltransferase subunit 1